MTITQYSSPSTLQAFIFKTTLIIRPPILAPQCHFEYHWTFIFNANLYL